MNLVALPAFTDNYIWLLHDNVNALVVDPGDAAPVEAALDALSLKLAGILVTHHHADHVGGVAALRDRHACVVHGASIDRMPPGTVAHAEGDNIELLGITWRVYDVPGHTLGHIAFDGTLPDGRRVLFCGDTLFSAGCGRLFEGTPSQMHQSLNKLAALPADTLVCCTHEYTLSNLRFANAVDPTNATLREHTEHCRRLRNDGHSTLPSTIALERMINPFLRVTDPDVRASALAHGATSDNPVDLFAALREWKNHF